MITFLESSVFESPAQTLVNTVNTVGVMGKGIAKEFKSRYPRMFREYRGLCEAHAFQVGNLHLWRSDTRWVLNFPTKTTWKLPSKMEYIERGLRKFVATYKDLGITSVSFPPLGCGNGNLNWDDVRPLMESHLAQVSIPVYIHDVQVPADFVAEHKQQARVPEDFAEFSEDLRKLAKDHIFATSKESQFTVQMQTDNSLVVEHQSGKKERIDEELLQASWVRLRERILSIDSFSDAKSQRLKSYLFPILSELPYICSVKSRTGSSTASRAEALFLDRDQYAPYTVAKPAQGWLFQ
ncbi:macro domain-containing protein [Mesorhizobium sp. CA4]|uniref:macro domain-containing protein n=1 Tax=Mesorhizobium sp. CA4 TaxID=588499 RepID=UPI001CD0DC2A|nr:macro domain-containing protein [Mesorhizobium sp. CA4]MBZ9818936.1 macro domain-containing protein [Mesorhizobium sp. CA4]